MANINKINVNGTVYKISDAAVRSSVAASYSASSAYAVGDYCLYDGQLYKCNTAIAVGGETWNASHWTAADIMSAVEDIAANATVIYTGSTDVEIGLDQGTVTLDDSKTAADVIASIDSGASVLIRVVDRESDDYEFVYAGNKYANHYTFINVGYNSNMLYRLDIDPIQIITKPWMRIVTQSGTVSSATNAIAKFTSSTGNEIGVGPKFGSDTTTFLRNDGTWQAPPSVTVDSALDLSSENPVQNKVVTGSLNEKEGLGRISVYGVPYVVNRKALTITDSLGNVQTYYVADITQSSVDSTDTRGGYIITVNLTNPVSPECFTTDSCVYQLNSDHTDAGGSYDDIKTLGYINSPTQQITVELAPGAYGIGVYLATNSAAGFVTFGTTPTVSGQGLSLIHARYGEVAVAVSGNSGNGIITITNVDYDED